jgi:hypothetical protein
MSSRLLRQIMCDATNAAISLPTEKSEEGKHERN